MHLTKDRVQHLRAGLLHNAKSVGIALALVLAALVPRLAAAEEAVADAQRETARGLMDEGDRLSEAGQHAQALKHYLAADEIMHVPTTGIEVARSFAAQQMLVESRAHAIRVAHSSPSPGEPRVFVEARAAARELAESLAERIPSIVVEVAVPNPLVRIDEMVLPTSALGFPFKVNPGDHRLTVAATGYQSVEQTFSLREAEQKKLTLQLEASKRSSPSALALTPAESPAAAPSPGVLSPAQVRGFVGIGVGAAGVVVGAIAGVGTLNRTRQIKRDFCDGNACDPAARPAIDKANTLAIVADIGFGVGIVGLGYGLYELLWGTKSSDTALFQAEPIGSSRLMYKQQSAFRLTGVQAQPGKATWSVNLTGEFK